MSADEAFLRHLLGGIVLQPERMRFDRTEDGRGILFRIYLAKSDMPLVIGKAGQSIKAVRLIMKMHAKDGPAISLKLEEPGHGMTFAARLADVGLDYAPATKDRSLADKLLGDALNYEKAGDEIIRAPELYIFDTCVRTIWEIEHYQWEDWRRKAAERKASKERPMDKDDHCIECVGRILVRQPSFHPMPAPRDAHSESTQGQQTQDFEVY